MLRIRVQGTRGAGEVALAQIDAHSAVRGFDPFPCIFKGRGQGEHEVLARRHWEDRYLDSLSLRFR